MQINHYNDVLALIARNLAGDADEKDGAQLVTWIDSSPYNRAFYENVVNIWDVSDRRIDPQKIDVASALETVMARIPAAHGERSLWFYWQKIAAIMIIPVAIGAFLLLYLNRDKSFSSNELIYNEVYAAFGTRSSLRLADSTLVWLNSGSSLKYPNKFTNRNRHVFLKGEAYFEVKSDASRPFVVETSSLQVTATGTEFNVQEYESAPFAEVTLVSGKVSVNKPGNKKNAELISQLSPDQHLAFDRHTDQKIILKGDSYKYLAWKDGKLIFRNEPLGKVLEKISMTFNVDIELQDEGLKDYRYRATFQDESLEEILKLLKLSAPICYREISRTPLPDGSFPKKKVIIFAKK